MQAMLSAYSTFPTQISNGIPIKTLLDSIALTSKAILIRSENMK